MNPEKIISFPLLLIPQDFWNNKQNCCHKNFSRLYPFSIGNTRCSLSIYNSLIVDIASRQPLPHFWLCPTNGSGIIPYLLISIIDTERLLNPRRQYQFFFIMKVVLLLWVFARGNCWQTAPDKVNTCGWEKIILTFEIFSFMRWKRNGEIEWCLGKQMHMLFVV